MDYGLDMDWILIQYFGAKWIWIGFGIRVESIWGTSGHSSDSRITIMLYSDITFNKYCCSL